MNIVKTRNPVEQGYVEAQTKVADALIGGEDVRRLRREAISRFEVTGFPARGASFQPPLQVTGETLG